MVSLLEEILNRIEYERLIEEGRDPIDVLHYKFSYVPSDIIDKIIDIDPTKKKSYSQWLLSKWKDEKKTIVDNLNNGRIAQLFQHYKNHNDIQIKDCPSVKEGLRMFVPEEDSVLSKSREPMTYIENLGREVDSELANDFDIVFNKDNWIIAVPNTYEAECKLGENMRWCTANSFGNGESFYKRYLSDGGKFYVNFDMSRGESRNGKDYPFTRYQFHFESNQFMDSNDDGVEISHIGMPESAKEFYISEGYSDEDFIDEEEKAERYEDSRNEYMYKINDDLYLCIEYNTDYELEEVDKNTSFYLYDINDDRDPITYETVPNPFQNDGVVISKTEEYVIIKTSEYDNFSEKDDSLIGKVLIAMRESDGYRDWETYVFGKYLILPEGLGIFGLEESSSADYYYTHLSSMGREAYSLMKGNDCKEIFINKNCTSKDQNNGNRLFIEAVGEKYHSLFTINYDVYDSENLNCVIKRDIPINNKFFVIANNGMIIGKFRKYRVYGDIDSNDEEQHYQLEKKLDNGDYVISAPSISSGVNVMSAATRRLVFKNFVDDVLYYSMGHYLVGMDMGNYAYKYAFINKNGDQVGEWYEMANIVDEENCIFGGLNKVKEQKFHLIDGKSDEVFAKFLGVGGPKPVNHIILVKTENGLIGYDYINRQMAYPQFESIQRLIQSNPRYFYCQLSGQDVYAIFDFYEQKVITSGIIDIKKADKYGEIMQITKINGKCNLFGGSNINNGFTLYEILPTDADEIDYLQDIQCVVIYKIKNKNFVYDYKTNSFWGNPDGSEIPCYFDSYGYLTYTANNINISFYRNKFKRWFIKTESGNYGGGSDRIDDRTPQNVINLYNKIIGNYNSLGEEFKKFVNRIDEAMKLRYNDIID